MSPLTRTVASMGGETYNPWRDLRGRDHIELRWGHFLGASRGLIRDAHPPPLRILTLDNRLDRRERRAVLAHELVHDERGLLPRSCPPAIREKDEHAVRAETARRLVPIAELRAFAAARCSTGESVTVDDVAEAFDVPVWVARRACEMAA